MRRSADLKQIARLGHVYHGDPSPKTLSQTGGSIAPALIGVNEASTFTGFCHRHDAATFLPIEQRAILPDDEQAFLLAYRPLAKELYSKQRHKEAMELLRSADKGKPLAHQLEMQELLTLSLSGVAMALEELSSEKTRFDAELIGRSFSSIRYEAFQLDRTPEIACSGVFHPMMRFDGKPLQDLGRLDEAAESASFSIIAGERGGLAIFAWHASHDLVTSAFVDSLIALPDSEKSSALVRFAFNTFENIFWSPDWWENLPQVERQSLIRRINIGTRPVERDRFDELKDDGIRPVAWGVAGVARKRS